MLLTPSRFDWCVCWLRALILWFFVVTELRIEDTRKRSVFSVVHCFSGALDVYFRIDWPTALIVFRLDVRDAHSYDLFIYCYCTRTHTTNKSLVPAVPFIHICTTESRTKFLQIEFLFYPITPQRFNSLFDIECEIGIQVYSGMVHWSYSTDGIECERAKYCFIQWYVHASVRVCAPICVCVGLCVCKRGREREREYFVYSIPLGLVAFVCDVSVNYVYSLCNADMLYECVKRARTHTHTHVHDVWIVRCRCYRGKRFSMYVSTKQHGSRCVVYECMASSWQDGKRQPTNKSSVGTMKGAWECRMNDVSRCRW